ncbi:MAG: response regulator [Oscillatoria princeps RMCB-10]|jgi:signal transduction histidine kinase|nr:response regulator [Oscillatoria princeps RMCB-10]
MNQMNIDEATILLVDDSPTNLKVLTGAITSCGWEILVATEGETALELAEYAKPDLILLDVMMPGIDGFETCCQLKAKPETCEIPVIFMTALSDTVDKVKGLSLGAVDYITKPFQQEEVIARVRLHLRLSLLTKQYAQQNSLLKQEISERCAAEAALQQLTDELERRVEERTAELQSAWERLQQTQVQLVQTEKMSALGQLVAGVAHEINNPVGSLSGNLNYIEVYTNNLLDLLNLYRDEFPKVGAKIESKIEDIDLEFLMGDLPKILTSMKAGTDRLRNISTSLRIFSRSDTDSQVAFNIHEGIDSTLLILKHRLKASKKRPDIKIITEYGDLPMVECYPGQLNQVFMNLIANAIDALDELSQGYSFDELIARPNTIAIRTDLNSDGTHAIISIKDNGPGMSCEVKERAFDHFFTTKTVGFGTGLGLYISRQIVEEKHQGRLSCISAPGEGAEFIIELPVCAPAGGAESKSESEENTGRCPFIPTGIIPVWPKL